MMDKFYAALLNSIAVLQSEIAMGEITYAKLEQLDELLDLRDKLAETKNRGDLC